jgi:glycine cleavage system transcriptional repressor
MEHLIIAAIGPSNSTTLNELALLAAKNDCLIEETRMTAMGTELATIMLISGNWNTIAKMEAAVNSLSTPLAIVTKRSKPLTTPGELLPYIVQIVATNRAGIIYEIINFFTIQNIVIDDLQTTTYAASLTAIEMLSLTMRIGITSNTSISDFHEQFAVLCDELNIDGSLEPEKP